MLIIGGGLSGLSAGCYGRMNGFETHVLEHAPEPGGVCRAWPRDPYVVDGCIHWLTGAAEGGAFRQVYEELGVVPGVETRVIDRFLRVEDPVDDWAFEVVRDRAELRRQMERLGPEDGEAIDALFAAVDAAAKLPMDDSRPTEIETFPEKLNRLWNLRHVAPTFLRFRGTMGEWADEHMRSERLRNAFTHLTASEMPALLAPFFLHLFESGQLSEPIGGSNAVSGAVIERYRDLGGELTTGVTVDEIVVEDGRATGVRLTDGRLLRADLVISTASEHETHQKLLGGRHLDDHAKHRIDEWPTFSPIVIVSVGVAAAFPALPHSLLVRQRKPLVVGGRATDWLPIRIFGDAPWVAPVGHTVLQSVVMTDYDHWAALGDDYAREKEAVIDAVVERMTERLPTLEGKVRMRDIATPLTFWRWARSWRGAFEGYLPTAEGFREHVPKRVPGVDALYRAGQWVEPGGGVPPALLSGRQVVEIVANDLGLGFVAKRPSR